MAPLLLLVHDHLPLLAVPPRDAHAKLEVVRALPRLQRGLHGRAPRGELAAKVVEALVVQQRLALLPAGLDDGRPPPTGAIGHLHRLTAHGTEVLGCAWRQRPRAPEQRALAWRLPLDALDGLGRLLRSGGSSGAGLGLATALGSSGRGLRHHRIPLARLCRRRTLGRLGRPSLGRRVHSLLLHWRGPLTLLLDPGALAIALPGAHGGGGQSDQDGRGRRRRRRHVRWLSPLDEDGSVARLEHF